MLKKLICSVVALSMLCSLALFPTSAVGASEVPDNTQKQIEETLSAVFDYLNSRSSLSLGHLENRVYNIPVGEEVVVASVRNEQVQTSRYADYTEYTIQKNTSYVFTLTINKIHSGSGSIVYKVYYNVGGVFGTYEDVYKLLITDATISVTPPTFYSAKEPATEIDHNWDNSCVGKVATALGFTNALLSDFDYAIKVELVSLEGNILRATYIYGPFND